MCGGSGRLKAKPLAWPHTYHIWLRQRETSNSHGLVIHTKPCGFARRLPSDAVAITVLVDSSVCFLYTMGNNNLQIALQQGVITQDAYKRVTEYAQRLNDNDVPVIYNLRHLRKIFRIKKREQDIFFGENKSSLYREFSIPKKSGGVRQIEAPCKRLKEIQRWKLQSFMIYRIWLGLAATIAGGVLPVVRGWATVWC